jgi:hypothetical protein
MVPRERGRVHFLQGEAPAFKGCFRTHDCCDEKRGCVPFQRKRALLITCLNEANISRDPSAAGVVDFLMDNDSP